MMVTKKDWKLFMDKIGDWQEAYMEKLLEEYVIYLKSDEAASIKFWELGDRIKEDRRRPGVSLELNKRNVPNDMARLIYDGVITMEDLGEFSVELRERVKEIIS